VIEQEGLVEAAATRGARLRSLLEDLQSRHPVMRALRGRGLLQGIELRRPDGSRFTEAEGVSYAVSGEAKRRGLMIYSCPTPVGTEHMDALLLAPPLIVTDGELDEIVERLDGALTAFEAGMDSRQTGR